MLYNKQNLTHHWFIAQKDIKIHQTRPEMEEVLIYPQTMNHPVYSMATISIVAKSRI